MPRPAALEYEFNVTREGDRQPLRVGTAGSGLADDPLQYRMQADDGRLVLWIDNPTSGPIELLGDKSRVTDPDGIDHPLHVQTIGPLSSIKEILPPMDTSSEDSAPPPPPQPLNPYDRPGFAAVPDLGRAASGGADSQDNIYFWQWEDASEIRLDLVFLQGQRQFEQHFTIQRVKK